MVSKDAVKKPRYRKVPVSVEKLAARLDADPLLSQVAPLPPKTFLAYLDAPGRAKPLNTDGDWSMNRRGEVRPSNGGSRVFDAQHLASAAVYIPYLFLHLPVGHPLRDRLPDLWARVVKRLENPRLLLPLQPLDLLFAPGNPKPLLDLFGSRAWLPAGYRGLSAREAGRDGGEFVALVLEGGMYLRVAYRPGRVDWTRPPGIFAGKLPLPNRRAFGPVAPDSLQTSLPAAPPSPACAQAVFSKGFAALAERVKKSPVPVGGWEANPLLSVPALVKEVRRARRLSEDAAILYLQTLALLEPSRRRVRGWNGWDLERYQAAAEELVARGLLVEERRARSGRGYFLPGSWLRPRRVRRKGERLRADAPFEAWKLPLYRLSVQVRSQGPVARRERILRPLGLLLPLEPLHRIFERAWLRVVEGDRPTAE